MYDFFKDVFNFIFFAGIIAIVIMLFTGSLSHDVLDTFGGAYVLALANALYLVILAGWK